MARKATTRTMVPTVAHKAGEWRPQTLLTESDCKFCGMPFIALSRNTVGDDPARIEEALFRSTEMATTGCVFCNCDGRVGVALSDEALTRWTDAFGLTERVVAVRSMFARMSDWEREQVQKEAVARINARYPKQPKEGKPGKDMPVRKPGEVSYFEIMQSLAERK